jgi:PhoH-like ATPase
MTTTYVLDTSALLSAGKNTLYSFPGQNDVLIPYTALRELENKKGDPKVGYLARSVIKELDRLHDAGSEGLVEGVDLGDGFGYLYVGTAEDEVIPLTMATYSDGYSENDLKIIATAFNEQDREGVSDVILVSGDLALRIVASLIGLKAQAFVPKNQERDFIDRIESFEVDGDIIDDVYKLNTVRLDLDVPRNVGVRLVDSDDPKHTALVIARPNYEFDKIQSFRVKGLESKNAEQAFAIDHLMNDEVKIVSLGGRAGTGKTTLALAAGIQQEKHFKNGIVVFRSMHAVGGEELGFLPGTAEEKLDPWTAAIFDQLEGFMDKFAIKNLKEKGIIKVLPLTHIRGRTLRDTFIIIDEAQNLTRETLLTALSRLGHGSKVALSWDVAQRDNHFVGRHDGIYEVVRRLNGEKLFAHVTLHKSERSEVAELVTRKLDDYEF